VNPKVFQEIVDPGLIKIIHKAMQLSAEPDTIKTHKRKQPKSPRAKATQSQPRTTDGRYKKADAAYRKEKDPKRRAVLWEERAQLRMAQEKRG